MSKSFNQPWGFSKLDTYRACPKQFFFQYVEKRPSPSNAAMERGGKLHENIEMYLNGWTPKLLPEIASWQEALDALKTKNFQAEQALGFSKAWALLPDWFHRDTWLRAKMDAKYLEGDKLTVIDFKSGKYRVPSQDQVELYAVVGSAMHPEANTIIAEFWFLDTGDIYTRAYTKEELIKLRTKYEQASAPLYTDVVWEAEPSAACRYCTYSRTKGGPCKY